MGLCVHVLIDGAAGSQEVNFLDGLLQLLGSRLHQGAVESTAHGQNQRTLGTGSLQLLACSVHSIHVAADYQLAGTVIVGRNHHAVTLGRNLCAGSLDGLVGQGDNGCHGAGSHFASLLHGLCTGKHQAKTVLEVECACSHQCAELTQ